MKRLNQKMDLDHKWALGYKTARGYEALKPIVVSIVIFLPIEGYKTARGYEALKRKGPFCIVW